MTGSPPRLLLAESAYDQMKAAATASHPNETGGILLGIYCNGTPWVTACVELPPTNPARARYRIPGGATQPTVQEAREHDERLGYLGDWHSHPANIGPSGTDMASLAYISVRHPLQPNPTSIVLRRVAERYEIDARRITHVHPRTCAVELTGDLPSPNRQEPT